MIEDVFVKMIPGGKMELKQIMSIMTKLMINTDRNHHIYLLEELLSVILKLLLFAKDESVDDETYSDSKKSEKEFPELKRDDLTNTHM